MSPNKYGLIFAALFCVCILVSCNQPDNNKTKATSRLTEHVYVPSLRAEIDNIKTSLAQSPTTEANVQKRAMLLWRWANAYALKGGYLPVDLPIAVAAVNMVPPPLAGQPRKPLLGFDIYKMIDLYLRELALHDEDESAVGELRLQTAQPALAARSYQTLTQTYKVGSKGVQVGGGFMLTSQLVSDAGIAQAMNPKADNFVSAKASRDGVQFEVDSYPLGGQHGGFVGGTKGVLVLRVKGQMLKPDDTVTFTYGDTSAGSKGFLVQSMSNERMPLPIYVDLTGNSEFFSLPIQPIKVVGVEANSIQVFAPSVVKPGENFSLSIRTQDKFGNRAMSGVPAYNILLNGKVVKTTEAHQSVVVVDGFTLAKAGTYRYTVRVKGHPQDGVILPAVLSNPIWVEDNPVSYVYWGETHAHSGFAEGIGTPDEFQRFARDDARLDFVGHSEHDAWLDDYEWATLQKMSEEYSVEGKFLSFLAYEWSAFPNNGGHHNVFFRTTAGRKRVPIQTAPKQAMLYEELGKNNDMNDVLIIPHAHMTGEWRMTDPGMERLVEIASIHGNFEWFGNAYLKNKAGIGFVAGADDHTSHPGLAFFYLGTQNRSGLVAVKAPALTRNDIFDTLRARRVYATTGARILMDVHVNDAEIGTQAPFAPERQVKAKISGTAPLSSVSVVKNGEIIWSKNFSVTNSDTASHRVRVSFYSGSEPFKGQFDLPRGYRTWEGNIVVKGAKIANVIQDGIRIPLYQYAHQAADDPSRVEFSTTTRGATEGFVIELSNITPQASLNVTIMPTKEGSASLPYMTRKTGTLSAGGNFDFSLKELIKGPAERAIIVDNFYRDLISMNFDDGKPVYDFSLDEIDRIMPRSGDYYYVRVLQKDGHMAWSSPIWIGDIAADD